MTSGLALPVTTMERALLRVASVWSPLAAPHHLIYGTSGAGKTTLIKALLALCPQARVLIVDPKPNADPAWEGAPGNPHQWGRAVASVAPRFGYPPDGGGPAGRWYRITGSPDRADTARRFAAALEIVANEGHTVLVLDDVRETCRQLRLAERVDSILNLGRSAGVCAVLSATETSYVAGRAQGAITWVGYSGGSLEAAKAGAGLLGWRGRDLQDTCAGIARHTWILSEREAGHRGPVLVAAS